MSSLSQPLLSVIWKGRVNVLVGAFVASVQFVVRKSVEAMKSIEHRLLRCPTSQHLQHCHACYNALLLCCLTARRGPYGLTVFHFRKSPESVSRQAKPPARPVHQHERERIRALVRSCRSLSSSAVHQLAVIESSGPIQGRTGSSQRYVSKRLLQLQKDAPPRRNRGLTGTGRTGEV